MKDTPNPIAIRSKKMITDTLFELLKASASEEITVTEIIQKKHSFRLPVPQPTILHP